MFSLDIKGKIKVELIDSATNAVKNKQEVNNAMMNSNLEYWRMFQKAVWSNLNYNNGGGIPSYSYPIRATHILLTDDSSVPSPTDASISGNLIGWASRWPVGSPTGKRGNVNTALCSTSGSSSTWVFEWPTSNGNGTFQSISWGATNNDNGYYASPEKVTVGTQSWPAYLGIEYSGNGNYFYAAYKDTTDTTKINFVLIDAVNGGNETLIAKVSHGFSSGPGYFACSGTYFVLAGTVGVAGSQSALVRKYNLDGTGATTVYNVSTGYTSVTGLAALGDAYLSLGGTIKLISLNGGGSSSYSSSYTGHIGSYGSEIITLDSQPRLALLDSSTSSINFSYVNNFSNAGNEKFNDTSVSPYAGTITSGSFGSINTYSIATTGTSYVYTLPSKGSPGLDNAINATTGPDGNIWFQDSTSNNIYKYNNKDAVSARALLPSPITKSSTDILRITYTINF